MSSRTLVDNNSYITRMPPNTLPVRLVVHLGARWLLVEVVKAVLELRVSYPSAEDGNWAELVQACLPTFIVELSVNCGPAAVRSTRWTHDDDQNTVSTAIVPEGRLLLGSRQVHAADNVEVGSATGGASTNQHMGRTTKSAAYLAYVISRRQTIRKVHELSDVAGTSGMSS